MENERIIISVIIPAFNEVDNIGECIERLLIEISKITHEYEVIIVNDGSTDETGKLITKISKKNKKIRTTGYEKNKGKGFAVRYGIKKAKGKYIVLMDADLDIHPRQIKGYLLRLIKKHKNTSIVGVIGSKLNKDSSVDFPLKRRLMSQIYYMILKMMFKLDTKDTQTGLKVFKGSAVKNIVGKLKIDGFAYDVELLVALYRSGQKVVDEPIDCKYTRNIDNRIGINNLITTAIDTIKIYVWDKMGKYNKSCNN